MYEYAEPQSVEEMMQRYAAVRRACYNPRVRNLAKHDEPIVAPVKRTIRLDGLVPHNEHVQEYRRHIHSQMVVSMYRTTVDTTSRTPVMEIIRQTAAAYGLRVSDIRGPRGNKDVIAARHTAMARAYAERPDLSLPAIGSFFKRDHTTLIHAVKKMGVWRNPGTPGVKKG